MPEGNSRAAAQGPDWERVQELFLAAADLAADERARLLDTACGGDAPLRTEVESLLAADRQAEAGISELLAETAHWVLSQDRAVGSRLGSWQVIREIGRGGMGTVYVAERDDDQFHKRVAVKLVKRGMETAELLDRFRRERQILASLNHPYIAGLIDGGSTVDGRPFLVMEYVEGEPIDEYIRRNDLGIQEILRLFLKICEAVSHAHRNLVVHRDLKPRNILIAEDGTPKLLDFGMAKLLAPDPDSSLTTVLSARRFTPDYASPEQVRGMAIGTATDVYSMGAVLYEVLTGSRPHRLQPGRSEDWERAICEGPVAPPSTAVVPGAARDERWRKRLQGDLDNIVLMAMRKDPARRYRSVDQFAADIRRYLDCRPVVARKDSLGYRASKFVRRQRLMVTAAGLALASLIAGMLLAVSQARRAETARQLAETQARRAGDRTAQILELSNRSLSDVYALLEHLPGAVPARQQLVNTTLGFLEKLSSDPGDNDRLRITLATAYLRLGDIQGSTDRASLRDMPGALKTYRAGAALLEPLVQRRSQSLPLALVWLDLQRAIGTILAESGQQSEAASTLERALETGAALAGSDAGDTQLLRRQNQALLSLARAIQQADPARALAYADRFLRQAAELARRLPGDPELQYDLSIAHTQKGYTFIRFGELEAAAVHYEKSLALREDLARRYPSNTVYRRALMLAYEHFAALQGSPLIANLGNAERAREYYGKARVLEEQSLADPNNRLAQYDYANFLLRSGTVEGPPETRMESLAALRRAAGMFESFLAAGPGIVRYKRDLTMAYEYLGHRLLEDGKTKEALIQYRRAGAIAEDILSTLADDRETLLRSFSVERGVIRALVRSADRRGALEHARNLIGRTERAAGRVPQKDVLRPSVAEAYLSLAAVHQAFAECDQARGAARRAILLVRPLLTGKRWDPNAKLLREAEAVRAECAAR